MCNLNDPMILLAIGTGVGICLAMFAVWAGVLFTVESFRR